MFELTNNDSSDGSFTTIQKFQGFSNDFTISVKPQSEIEQMHSDIYDENNMIKQSTICLLNNTIQIPIVIR